MRNSSGVVVLALAVATSAKAQQPGALDSVFAAYDRTDRPGCAVAVSRNGQVLAARGFGMSDLAQSLAITPRSVFHVASVSKQFTAMSLVLLARSGAVSLDDQWRLLMTAGWTVGSGRVRRVAFTKEKS